MTANYYLIGKLARDATEDFIAKNSPSRITSKDVAGIHEAVNDLFQREVPQICRRGMKIAQHIGNEVDTILSVNGYKYKPYQHAYERN